MKHFGYVLPLILLSACTSDSDVVRVGSFLYGSITGSVEKIPREQAAAIPFASIGMELGRAPQALLVLGATREGQLEWYGGEEIFVATRLGRVTRTLGLPYDLGGLNRVQARPIDLLNEATPSRASYLLDFPDLGIFGATANCSSRNVEDEEVEILGARIPTHHAVEHCEVPAMRWSFDNEFWSDRTSGYVWRSRQHIHPDSPPITLEVLRPEQNGPG